MEVNYEKNNIVNLTNSILKYFDIKPYHNTIEKLDRILEKNKYNNIVLFVCDGLGYYNLKELLQEDDFLRKQKTIPLSSVFPPTTTAATTTLLTGLDPSEHHWYGWDMYFKDTDETISLFLDKIKDSNELSKKKVKERSYMRYKTIIDLINENTSYEAYYAYPFSKDNKCLNLDEVIERILLLTKDNKKKFIYAYIEDPDKNMHQYGIKSKQTKEVVENINQKLEKLSKSLKNTLLLVTADHGLIDTKTIVLKRDMREIYDMLDRTTTIDSRCVGLKIKETINKDEFIKIYEKKLKKDFNLLTTEEVIKRKIFGSEDNSYLRDTIGDYLLIGTAKKSIYYNESHNFKANHSGYTKKELTVPLIIID